ncbi:hypothetical protein NQZ68_005572 [Dissostichus eleginoides]|nr:hypothetical protein NQZ68_005572 [Dissostichus eleginoides]
MQDSREAPYVRVPDDIDENTHVAVLALCRGSCPFGFSRTDHSDTPVFGELTSGAEVDQGSGMDKAEDAVRPGPGGEGGRVRDQSGTMAELSTLSPSPPALGDPHVAPSIPPSSSAQQAINHPVPESAMEKPSPMSSLYNDKALTGNTPAAQSGGSPLTPHPPLSPTKLTADSPISLLVHEASPQREESPGKDAETVADVMKQETSDPPAAERLNTETGDPGTAERAIISSAERAIISSAERAISSK